MPSRFSAAVRPREPAAATAIPIWDGLVRLFHWGTAILVAAAFIFDDRTIHETVGLAVLVLVLLRINWGFVGTRHARFSDFVTGPGAVRDYLRDLRQGRPRRFLGHNPAGGAMVLALLATLIVTSVSGWMSDSDRWFGVDWVSALHSGASSVLLVLIVLHLAGVLVASLLHRENLVRAMVTGRKPAE